MAVDGGRGWEISHRQGWLEIPKAKENNTWLQTQLKKVNHYFGKSFEIARKFEPQELHFDFLVCMYVCIAALFTCMSPRDESTQVLWTRPHHEAVYGHQHKGAAITAP